MNKFECEIEEKDIGKRLDVSLFEILKAEECYKAIFSRSKLQELIKKGNVLVNNKAVKPSFVLSLGDRVTILLDDNFGKETEITPWNVPLDIVYEDDDLLVVNKQKEFIVHPGAGNKDKTLLNAVISKLSFNEESSSTLRIGIVHRIDKDTTGLLVIAKNEFTQAKLMEQFKEHSVDRTYVALVLSTPRADREVNKSSEGVIDTYIGRHPTNRLKMSVLEEGNGKRAITHWRKLEEYKYACLLEFKLETGRTHQIRVHMDNVASPIIGDRLYGDFSLLPKDLKTTALKFGRQALHAKTLSFTHPVTEKRLSFDSEIPEDMKEIIEIFKNRR